LWKLHICIQCIFARLSPSITFPQLPPIPSLVNIFGWFLCFCYTHVSNTLCSFSRSVNQHKRGIHVRVCISQHYSQYPSDGISISTPKLMNEYRKWGMCICMHNGLLLSHKEKNYIIHKKWMELEVIFFSTGV
jgi:hypothetical protein